MKIISFMLHQKSRGLKLLGLLAFSFFVETQAVYALPSSYQLPVELAVQAATEAVKVCQRKGYGATATVVTQEGLIQATIRGDGATPHTIGNSFNKAYTVISLGPVQRVTSTAEIVKSMTPSPNPVGNWPMPASPLPGITFTAGGLAFKVGNQIIGGLGVSGAPAGNIDEECARAGLNKIKSQLVP